MLLLGEQKLNMHGVKQMGRHPKGYCVPHLYSYNSRIWLQNGIFTFDTSGVVAAVRQKAGECSRQPIINRWKSSYQTHTEWMMMNDCYREADCQRCCLKWRVQCFLMMYGPSLLMGCKTIHLNLMVHLSCATKIVLSLLGLMNQHCKVN